MQEKEIKMQIQEQNKIKTLETIDLSVLESLGDIPNTKNNDNSFIFNF